MEHKACTAKSDLEHMLVDETADPKALPLSLLEDITCGFSDDKEIGRGGFAVVYMGILGNRKVAVKRLSKAYMHETEFHREVECLMRVKHKNVVRFLGYCADRQGSMEMYNGKFVMADVHQRLLCFEYIPNGSLEKYIKDANRDWGTCYNIIKGICEGIQYLHENHIIHLDLKPANILLGDNMIPKISDFGLSRCFDENQSRDITKTILGTMGYLAPELREGGVIARSADLYSLGVIIMEILNGHKGYQAIEDVLECWNNRFERSQRDRLCEQITVCYDTAIECRDFNPKKRPASAGDIVHRFREMEIIQTTGAASFNSGAAVTESNGKSNTNDPRVVHYGTTRTDGHPLVCETELFLSRPASLAAEDGSAYGFMGMNPSLAPIAKESLEKAWPSEVHSHSHDGLNKTRFNVYYSPNLMYLRVVAISAQDLVPSEKGRPLAPTVAKIQIGSQIQRTRPQGSGSPTWKEEFMFVTSEPLEEPLVVTVEERVRAGRDEAIGRVVIPVAKSVSSKWFILSRARGGNSEEVAGKIHLQLSLDTEYHALT